MATRKDGRIEAGQRLSRAISARAWNRAQDAADIVLGSRPSLAAGDFREFPGSLVVPCWIPPNSYDVKPGYVVNFTGGHAAKAPEGAETFVPRVTAVAADVMIPTTFANYASLVTRMGVVVGGTAMPNGSTGQIVRVCVSGMCVARVRNRGAGTHLQQPVIRSDSDTVGGLAGCAESSSCGIHRILEYLSAIDESTGIYYAVVIL